MAAQGDGAARRPGPPAVDVLDSTWIGLPPERLAAAVADPARWRRWWPELRLAVDDLRGEKGVRWQVLGDSSGTVRGSMEVWLQPVPLGRPPRDELGTLAHLFLRLDAVDGGEVPARTRATLVRRYRARAKQVFWELSDALDPDRLARVAPPPGPAGGGG